MSGDDGEARRLEDKIRRETKARLLKAKAEGRLVKVKLAPQGVVVEVQARAAGTHVEAELAEQGVVASGDVARVRWLEEDPWHDHREQGRPPEPETEGRTRAAHALARQREFQHPNGEPNVYKIARSLGWNDRSVGRALKSRQK
jgi:hypothetical protein